MNIKNLLKYSFCISSVLFFGCGGEEYKPFQGVIVSSSESFMKSLSDGKSFSIKANISKPKDSQRVVYTVNYSGDAFPKHDMFMEYQLYPSSTPVSLYKRTFGSTFEKLKVSNDFNLEGIHQSVLDLNLLAVIAEFSTKPFEKEDNLDDANTDANKETNPNKLYVSLSFKATEKDVDKYLKKVSGDAELTDEDKEFNDKLKDDFNYYFEIDRPDVKNIEEYSENLVDIVVQKASEEFNKLKN